MYWEEYGGQSLKGFHFIGTEDLKYPINERLDVEAAVKELKRRYGKDVNIKIWRMEEGDRGDR